MRGREKGIVYVYQLNPLKESLSYSHAYQLLTNELQTFNKTRVQFRTAQPDRALPPHHCAKGETCLTATGTQNVFMTARARCISCKRISFAKFYHAPVLCFIILCQVSYTEETRLGIKSFITQNTKIRLMHLPNG